MSVGSDEGTHQTAAVLSDGHWRSLPTSGGASDGMLVSVSCLSLRQCVIAGSAYYVGGGIVEQWDGGSTVRGSILPPTSTMIAWNGVACTPAGCVAAGSTTTNGGDTTESAVETAAFR